MQKKVKNIFLKFQMFTLIVVFSICLVNGQSNTQAPYQVSDSLSSPLIFGKGIISTSEDELNAAFSPDGTSIYFSKNAPGNKQGVIVISHFIKGKWSEPQVAPFSGQYSDYDPFFSADGSKLFFISDRPTVGTKRKVDYDIWFVEKIKEGWSKLQNIGAPINTERNEYYPSIAADGTIYFSTNNPNGKGGYDLYFSRLENGKYTEPQNLGDANAASSEIDSYVAPDQSYIIFASYGRADSLGDGDLYISYNRNGKWSDAKTLGSPINSSAREYCPIASPDGKYFFFTSLRGFADETPAKPYTYSQLKANLNGILNGMGNIYQIQMSVINTQ